MVLLSEIVASIKMPNRQNKQKLKILSNWIRKLVRQGKKDLFVRQFTARLLNARKVRAKDIWREITTLHEFVRDKIIYRKDPNRIEFFQTPNKMLRDYLKGRSAGDCDDKSILLSAMLESIGHKTVLVLVNPRGGRYTHVLPFVNYPPGSSKWVPLETTLPMQPGWMPKTYNKYIIKT